MAAYAALTSLINIIHQIQHHPSPPISLNIKSLTENVTFFQEFLECYKSPVAYSNEADPLEMRIADAAHAAEDVIESHIVDMIELQRSTTSCLQSDHDLLMLTSTSAVFKYLMKKCFEFLMKPINYWRKRYFILILELGMWKVMKDMDLIKKDVMKMKMKMKEQKTTVVEAHASASGGSSSRSSIMVGFDDVLLEVLDKLIGGRHHLQVIPIVGMGGIGKTTLVKAVFGNALIKHHFVVCAWATISQNYNTKEILCELFSQVYKETKEESSNMTEDELGSKLYKYLFGRRFMIVLDDMWCIEAWNKLRHFFPNNNNQNRIVVTTRLSILGPQLDKNYCLRMKFLNEVSSWDLFSKFLFGEKSCPLELEEIGKKIVRSCRGLPLAIVVVGGLLKKLEHTKGCWESMRKNSSSVVLNSENEDFCLKILKMSYNHLPMHLKPCFLHMGVFEEDRAVRVSTLVKLWVSEGFLKPVRDKSLETIAKEYLNDLVERNLILVDECGSTGSIKYCRLHDLLRDLCLREAGKEGFYYVTGQNKFRGLHRKRRCFVIPRSTSKEEVHYASRYRLLARTFVCDSKEVLPLPKSRLLRTLKTYDRDTSGSHDYEFGDVFRFVNSRYLAVGVRLESKFPSSVGLLWNLQTLVVFHSGRLTAPREIWTMPQLRHVEFYKGTLELPNPLHGNRVIMENLQTLKGVCDLNLGVVVSNIIPNIKKLGLSGGIIHFNLIRLSKLESFRCWNISYVEYCTFPYSLKHLSLGSDSSHWDLNQGLLDEIGALPLLQKLKLERVRFQWKGWKTSEDQFPSLKFLKLKWCLLESWMTESSHFPRLEQLHLCGSRELEGIPSEIGEIPTLQSILLEYCSEPMVESAKKITEEQEELRVRVVLFNNDKNQALRRRLASPPNFLVEIVDF